MSTLENKLKDNGFAWDLNKIEKINLFKEEVLKENENQNLTSNTSDYDFDVKNILDSLLITKFLEYKSAENILDLGSGAGFPGIPLSINSPSKNFVLVEIRRRRFEFLKKIVEVLNLNNVLVVKNINDVEKKSFLILVRAVGKIDYVMNISSGLISAKSSIVFYKGKNILNEIDFIRKTNYDSKIVEMDLIGKYTRNFIFLKR